MKKRAPSIPSVAQQAREGMESLDKWAEGKTRLRVTLATRDGKRTTFRATRDELQAQLKRAQDLKAIRAGMNLSQPGFAHLIRSTPPTVRQWEQGRRAIPEPILTLAKLAREMPAVRKRLEAMAGPAAAPATAAASGTQKRAAMGRA